MYWYVFNTMIKAIQFNICKITKNKNKKFYYLDVYRFILVQKFLTIFPDNRIKLGKFYL